ncbi:MAG: hypothetical protein IPL28_00690 [Chloroflexi bacterium]|nr:hypothetical protein [Chloroflexota bacterium]
MRFLLIVLCSLLIACQQAAVPTATPLATATFPAPPTTPPTIHLPQLHPPTPTPSPTASPNPQSPVPNLSHPPFPVYNGPPLQRQLMGCRCNCTGKTPLNSSRIWPNWGWAG